MFIAKDSFGQDIMAMDGKKSEAYFCPVCESPVILKIGQVKLTHFSHQNIQHCSRYLYKRESIKHLQLKHDLYQNLNHYFNVAMEYYLSDIDQIPDLLINHQTVIEIQLSRISPDLLLMRTEGYHKLNMQVVWLLDDDIKRERNLIKLNHFQISALHKGSLYTIDSAHNRVKKYIIGHHLGFNYFTYDTEHIPYPLLIKSLDQRYERSVYKMTERQMVRLIQRERAQRSVLNSTLTYLYQLNIPVKEVPDFLYYVSPLENYILNSPLEWKLYIYYHLNQANFSLDDFKSFIKTRVMAELPDKNLLINQLLRFYLDIFRFSE